MSGSRPRPATSPCWRARSSRRCRSRAPRSSTGGPGARWNRRSVDATLDAQELSIEGTDVGQTRATFALAGNRLRVEASAPALAIVARGDLDTRAPYAYQAEVRLDRAKIPALVPVRPARAGARLGRDRDRDAHARGHAAAADAGVGRRDLDELDAVVNGTRVVLEAPAAIAWTPEPRRGHRREPARRTQAPARASRDRWAPSRPAIPCGSRPRVRCPSWLPSPGPQLPADVASPRTARWRSTWRSAGRCARPCPTARSPCAPPASRMAISRRPPASSSTRAWIRRASSCGRSARPGSRRRSSADATVPLRLIARAIAEADGQVAADGWASRWLASLPPEPARASLSARVTGITPKVLEPFAGAETLREVGGTMALTVTADAGALSIEQARGDGGAGRGVADAGRRPVQADRAHAAPARERPRQDRGAAVGLARQPARRHRQRGRRRGSASHGREGERHPRPARARRVRERRRHERDGPRGSRDRRLGRVP